MSFWAGGAAAGEGGDEAAFVVSAGAGGEGSPLIGDVGRPGGDTRLWLGACAVPMRRAIAVFSAHA